MEKAHINLAKVREAYQAFASGNLKTLIDNISEDVIWNNHLNPASPFYGDHRGIESFEEYFSTLTSDSIQEVDVHTALESGHKSIVLIDIKGTRNYVHVLRFARGKVIQIDTYNRSAEA